MDDAVAKDAKRLLLRYGAPIAVVEKLSDEDRITYARSIIKTELSERGKKVKQLLTDAGYTVYDKPAKKK